MGDSVKIDSLIPVYHCRLIQGANEILVDVPFGVLENFVQLNTANGISLFVVSSRTVKIL